ncbi:MAG: transpeptidase family protein [Bacteroidales bacterium]|nr:transpeptidase family protein [Bacteroidales bacterium]
MSREAKKKIMGRVYIVFGIMAFVAMVIFARIVYIQVYLADELEAVIQKQSFKNQQVPAIRGNIYSSNNELLATSVPVYALYWDSQVVPSKTFEDNIDSLSYYYNKLYPYTSASAFKKKMRKAFKARKRYQLVARNVDHAKLKELRKMPIFRLGKYRGGLIIEKSSRRKRPYQMLAKRTIGIYSNVRKDYVVGLEGAFNDKLKGVDGLRLVQKIPGGWRPVFVEGSAQTKPVDGLDIITSLNVNIQDVAENSLKRQLEKHRADWGCVVLMEVKTGQVKAIANLKRDTLTGNYYESYNYAIGRSVEPGSTFKLASLIVALEDKKVSLSDIIKTVDGEFRYKGSRMSDSHKGGFGDLTVEQVLEKSSNVGVFKIILKAYEKNPQKFIDGVYKLGLHRSLGLQIKGEGRPYIKNTEDDTWSGISLPWMSIGYEMSLTPLQILTFYNAVANGGKMVKPMFVNEVSRTGVTVEKYQTQVINSQIASAEVIKMAQQMLEGVVQEGTATALRSSPYTVAGKTGTAQTNYSQRQHRRKYRASFAGYFPADNPKYSIIVVIDNPKGYVYYASQLTVPVFKDIADKIYAHALDIQPDDSIHSGFSAPESLFGAQDDIRSIYTHFDLQTSTPDPSATWAAAVKKQDNVALYIRNYQEGILPNLKGMTARDVVFFLEELGYHVKISGMGKVRSQSIPSGARVQKGANIEIKLGL